ncbi:hypothetical protein H0B56_14340 [Haloechinothrix sp. YIM 98757]|uniref:Uncharacterized protein n=1 Tax=Haloechinothrix aidingensis TaxID=2752311 RepID=A0A838ABW4_9PSEU|nr:hypothetical protein [Haloechinothrix aidingensis]MBA0126727.1 hypothetical protein [Haloechinothrix aidingensis]
MEVVERRTVRVLSDGLDEHDQDWKDPVKTAPLDPFRGSRRLTMRYR